MNGIRIAKPNADLSGNNPSFMQLDTSLETLPTALFAEWSINVYTGYEAGVSPPLEAEVTHGLGYFPMCRGWEAFAIDSISGNPSETRYESIPTGMDYHGFLTSIQAGKNSIFIRTEFAAVTYAGPTYRKKGYIYIYEKKFEGLPE